MKSISSNSLKQSKSCLLGTTPTSTNNNHKSHSNNNDKIIQINVEHTQSHKMIIEFISGALGGIVSRTATAPLDRIKTYQQVYAIETSNMKQLKLRFIFKLMIKEGNYLSLWRGNWVNIVKTAPENAIKLMSYEKFKLVIQAHNSTNSNSLQEKFICGSLAGFVSQLVLFPLKTVKVMMNLRQTNEYKGIFDCMYKMYIKNGLLGFYRGLMANSIAIMPSSGIDLATYETLKKSYSKHKNKQEPNVIERIIIGNISSTIGNLVVYPLIFARTRLQSNRNLNERTLSLLRQIYRKDGLFGLYRGFYLHILKIGPAASLSYITFEYFNKLFNINSLE